MTNKEILLKWIDVILTPSFYINQDNYITYLGDIQEPFTKIIEYKIRKQILEKYLEKPSEETIDEALEELRLDFMEDKCNIEKRALNRVLTRFNKSILK